MAGTRKAAHPQFDLRELGLFDSPGDDVFRRITALAAATLRVDTALLVLVDRRTETLRLAASEGFDPATHPIDGLPADEVFNTLFEVRQGVLALSDLRDRVPQTRRAMLDDLGFRGVLAAPVQCPAGLAVGVLSGVSGNVRIWSRNDRKVLADLAVLASERILLRASLRTISILSG